jgi:hypothetical protein
MNDFDPMDFQPNSVGVLVVRIIRLQDIVKALRCTEDFALKVVREIRGETSADGEVAFVLPSQLAAWAYKRAGKPVAPFPFKTILVNNPTNTADALRRAAIRDHQQPPSAQPPSKRSRTKLILSKREAARLLGVGRNKTLNELIARGLLKTVVVNGHIKVPRADVERIAAKGFDLDAPTKRIRHEPKSRNNHPADLEAVIRKLKI